MDCPPTRAEAWLDEHTRDVVGLQPSDAAALIAEAGLEPRVIHSGDWSTEELRDDRVNLRLTTTGEVGTVDAG